MCASSVTTSRARTASGIVFGMCSFTRFPSARRRPARGARCAADGALERCAVRAEHPLDLDGRPPDAARLDHVVASAGVEIVAVFVLVVAIAGPYPIPAERVLRGLVLVPVERHRG